MNSKYCLRIPDTYWERLFIWTFFISFWMRNSRVYGIPKVRRSDYLVFDQGDLACLNVLERFNCLYCSYGNGIAAWLREIAVPTKALSDCANSKRILGQNHNAELQQGDGCNGVQVEFFHGILQGIYIN